eukprot:CAMPEP_0195588162 /NCGR_PEP_ID=MMETSP0814-20130614/32176_1 /TAXON_ID=97485 /ORGANISM="Prymnesium parvum, Strain Texoma1" /LENGTH=68 /DNA_ID=CAMNT_0040727073 /DNA_START=54 /DNA_END=257 /DNA_ORIENTATION=-
MSTGAHVSVHTLLLRSLCGPLKEVETSVARDDPAFQKTRAPRACYVEYAIDSADSSCNVGFPPLPGMQ